MDPHDPASTHYLALIGDEAVATARARMVDGVMKIQRVAVLKALRGRGIGRALVERIVEDHPEIDKFAISAQVEAVPFYRALGFAAHGHEYLDAGIPHRDMSLER
ncbi:MAG: GNAT family N-acetyltransferase [Neomegalonema sp.]|nr:GNAT family N-acetyltransferase [Neomegalonema sp.]